MTSSSDTALLVIDAQESFRRRVDDWAATANPAVVDNIALLVAHAREGLLQRDGIRRLVVCGIRTEQCCETTTRVAADFGFDVEFITDATTTSSIPAADGLTAVSGEDIMRRTESILSARGFATISSTRERVRATADRALVSS